MLMVGLRKLILNCKPSLDISHLMTVLLIGIVSPQSAGGSLIPDEILIGDNEISFAFHAMAINVVCLQSIKDLCTLPFVEDALAVCKDGVCADCFTEPVHTGGRIPALPMSPHGMSDV